jgi:hypothetical protein
MRPEQNGELLGLVATHNHTYERLAEETVRREMLTPNLSDLSDAFGQIEETDHHITDPTLVMKLYALAKLQATEFGVSGTNPLDAVTSGYSYVHVRAQVAPAHDEFHSEVVNGPVRTRAIRLKVTNGEPEEDQQVELFGLNLFTPDLSVSDEPETQAPSPTSKLIVVSTKGRLTGVKSYITGEIPIVAVRNKETRDAKVYAFLEGDIELLETEERMELERSGTLIKGKDAFIRLPGGKTQIVRELTEDMQRQAATEFESATRAIKQRDIVTLTDSERAAATSAGSAQPSKLGFQG